MSLWDDHAMAEGQSLSIQHHIKTIVLVDDMGEQTPLQLTEGARGVEIELTFHSKDLSEVVRRTTQG
jgi:hypothetical protein